MRVGINAISAKKGGILSYTKNLIDYLKDNEHSNEYHIWVPRDFPRKGNGNVILHKTNATYYSYIKRLFYEQYTFRKELKEIDIDVLFSSANHAMFFSPCPQILLIRNNLYFDNMYKKYALSKFSNKKKLEVFLRKNYIGFFAKRSDMIMFPSNTIKNYFLKDFSINSDVIVNHFGTNISNFKNQNGNLNNYNSIKLLYVSAYYYHKNPGIISKAIDILNDKINKNIKCKITMDLEVESLSFHDIEEINLIKNNKNIDLGRVPYEKIPQVYKESDYFIFPSYCESFGHPMIEAMAAGLPIIAADTDINREICGDSALYFSPFDAEELADKILYLESNTDKKSHLINSAKKRIEKFSWDRHMQNLIKEFENIAY